MRRTVIVEGARTPFGKFGGALQALTASELGGYAIKEAVERSGVNKEDIQEVIMGNVLQGGQGQLPSRQASRHAGLSWEVETETINKVCASGMRSVTAADQIIRSGDGTMIIAGGMESMSNAPYIVPKARWGARMGDTPMKDLMVHDGLTCSFQGVHMGVYGNTVAEQHEISREMQDEWALRSHERAVSATDNGRLRKEIVGVTIPQRKGEDLVVEEDEAPRRNAGIEQMRKLSSIFSKDGTITAGNAPGVNDGACAMVLMEELKAEEAGLNKLATIVGHTALALEAENFPKTPGLVIQKLLKKTGKRLDDIKLFEINEAFSAVALTSNKIAGLSPEKVNVNGGAVALGHPIGASGARIILTLAYELRERGGGLGIAAICSGGGQGDAVLIEV
ncbi:acetyl-CoA C-acetyltransferase [Thalassorhabdus alkalitolerans]|uniref:acetyl-CoA C-acetyltransferase n=1 Tax=Thalassorhabdus alkalitolerans TaxID=2282697 RepID=A0ABW0YIP7_9BACI